MNLEISNKKLLNVIQKVSAELFPVLEYKYWDNTVICGGYALDLLYGTNHSTDIDIYIYNTKDKNHLTKKISQEIIKMSHGNIVYETAAVITFTTKGKQVQIINSSSKKSIDEIVETFDFDVSKVYFNGYLNYPNNSVSQLVNKVIDVTRINPRPLTFDRLAKYIQFKKFNLTNLAESLSQIDPLYFFKECNNIDKTFQMLSLVNDNSLLEIYNLIFIRNNPSYTKMHQVTQYGRANDSNQSSTSDKKYLHQDRGMSSELEDLVKIDYQQYNNFGLHKTLYGIKNGTYVFDELFECMETDIAGFNVSCYMVMYEKDENVVIQYFGNAEKFSSKNFNSYDLSYLEIAALLNRQKLVKYFMHKTNYKTVMEIAVREDNLDLYLMAYKLFNGDDRYLFTKEQLLKSQSYKICAELYGDASVSIAQTATKSLNEPIRSEQIRLSVDSIVSRAQVQHNEGNYIESFVKYYYENQQYLSIIYNYVISRCVKNVIMTDAYKWNSLSTIEKEFYGYKAQQINDNTQQTYNALLENIIETKSVYDTVTTVSLDNPLKKLKDKYTAIQMHSGHLDDSYNFDNETINELIVYFDNIELINKNQNKKMLLENVLNRYQLKTNLSTYKKNHFERDTVLYYSKMLYNTHDHDNAYKESRLSAEYERRENAIGYTPDDIIIFKTFNDHRDKKIDPIRSQSVKNIKRIDIMQFTEKVTRDHVLAYMPEIFNFEHTIETALKTSPTKEADATCQRTGKYIQLDKSSSEEDDEDENEWSTREEEDKIVKMHTEKIKSQHKSQKK